MKIKTLEAMKNEVVRIDKDAKVVDGVSSDFIEFTLSGSYKNIFLKTRGYSKPTWILETCSGTRMALSNNPIDILDVLHATNNCGKDDKKKHFSKTYYPLGQMCEDCISYASEDTEEALEE